MRSRDPGASRIPHMARRGWRLVRMFREREDVRQSLTEEGERCYR